MKRIALKFGTTARVKAATHYEPSMGGGLDFSRAPMGPNPPTL